jgi:hypothetical protein
VNTAAQETPIAFRPADEQYWMGAIKYMNAGVSFSVMIQASGFSEFGMFSTR